MYSKLIAIRQPIIYPDTLTDGNDGLIFINHVVS